MVFLMVMGVRVRVDVVVAAAWRCGGVWRLWLLVWVFGAGGAGGEGGDRGCVGWSGFNAAMGGGGLVVCRWVLVLVA